MDEKEEFIRSLVRAGKTDAEISAALATWKPTGKPVVDPREAQVRALVKAGKSDAEITRLMMPSAAADATHATARPFDPIDSYDQTTGGPEKVRLAMMAAGTSEDQLRAAQQMMPNANVHMSSQGPAFTNAEGKNVLITPRTGQRMLTKEWWLNHKPNTADMVESVPDVFSAMSAIGASFVPGGIFARTGAAAAGNAVGQQASRLIAKGVNRLSGNGPAVDTRSAGDIAQEGLLDAAAGGVGELVGPMIPKVPGAIVGAGRAARVGAREYAGGAGAGGAATAAKEAFLGRGNTTLFGGVPSDLGEMMMRQGLEHQGAPVAPISVTSKSPAVRKAGMAVEQGLAGAPLTEAKNRTVSAIDQRMKDLFGFEGTPVPHDNVATVVRDAVKTNTRDFTDNINRLKSAAFDGPEGTKLVAPTNVRKVLAGMEKHVKEFPESRTPRFEAAIEQLQRVVTDAGDKGIPVRELKDIMSDVGEMQARAAKGMADGKAGVAGASGPLAQAYDALNTEVRTALGDTPAAKAFDGLNSLVRARRSQDNVAGEKVMQGALRGKNNLKSSMDLIMGNAPEATGARAIRLQELRRTTDTKTWGSLRASRLAMLGREAGENSPFTVQKLADDLGAFSEREQAAWGLSETQRKNLKEMHAITKEIAERGLPAVGGSTNNALYVIGKVSAASTVVTATGSPLAGLGALAAAQGLQSGIARALASPTLGRWLTTTMRVVEKNPRALAAQLGRLAALKKTHKELAPDIDGILMEFEKDQQN